MLYDRLLTIPQLVAVGFLFCYQKFGFKTSPFSDSFLFSNRYCVLESVVVLFNTVERGYNHFKNPVAERQRTLKTRLREFDWEMLQLVKSLSNKYQNNQDFGFSQYRGAHEN